MDMQVEDCSEPTQTVDLLERARHGERGARDALVARVLPAMRRFARGRLPAGRRDIVDTEDLVQSALLKMWRNVDHIALTRPGDFLAYLRQSVLNAVRDELKHLSRRPGHGELDEEGATTGQTPLEDASQRETIERYERALLAVDSDTRELVMMRMEFELSYQEIADALALPSAECARKRISRALVEVSRAMGG